MPELFPLPPRSNAAIVRAHRHPIAPVAPHPAIVLEQMTDRLMAAIDELEQLERELWHYRRLFALSPWDYHHDHRTPQTAATPYRNGAGATTPEETETATARTGANRARVDHSNRQLS